MTDANRFWAKVEISAGCWVWQGSERGKGYGQFWFAGRPTRAHRVAWMLTHGKIPKGRHVLHTCDNRKCVNPAHLYLGTNEDNCRDMAMRGRHGSQKLSNVEVEEIRCATGIKQADLAKQFGVSDKTISEIRSGKSRAWVTGAPIKPRIRKVRLTPSQSP